MASAEVHATSLDALVDELLPRYATSREDRADGIGPDLPHYRRVIEAFDLLREALLPAGMSPEAVQPPLLRAFLAERLTRAWRLLAVEVARALPFRCIGAYAQYESRCTGEDRPLPGADELMAEAQGILTEFFRELPAIRDTVVSDIEAGYRGDPAALSYAEVMLTYPGLQAIISHRIAHRLYELDVPIVPRIMSERTHARSGIDIHPGATIGQSFFMDHATGIVIGETARVGRNVKLYQGVTLGAKSFPLDESGHPQKKISRHPIVEDDVIIYANATILGQVTIGRGSEIGGNVFLTRSVPPGSRVRQRIDVEVQEPEQAG